MSVEGGPSCPEAYMGPTKLMKRERKLQKKLVKVKAKIAVAKAPKAVAPVRDQSPPPRVPTSLFMHATSIEHPGEHLKSLFAPAVGPIKETLITPEEFGAPCYKKTGRCFTITLPFHHGFPNFDQLSKDGGIVWNGTFLEAGEFRITSLLAAREAAVDEIERKLAKMGYRRRFK
jgi:hypothetical protein